MSRFRLLAPLDAEASSSTAAVLGDLSGVEIVEALLALVLASKEVDRVVDDGGGVRVAAFGQRSLLAALVPCVLVPAEPAQGK